LNSRLVKFSLDRAEFILNPKNWRLWGKAELFTCYALDLPFYGKRIFLNFDLHGHGRFEGNFIEHLELEEISRSPERQYLFQLNEFESRRKI